MRGIASPAVRFRSGDGEPRRSRVHVGAAKAVRLRGAVGLAYASASRTSGAADEHTAISSQALKIRLYGPPGTLRLGVGIAIGIGIDPRPAKADLKVGLGM